MSNRFEPLVNETEMKADPEGVEDLVHQGYEPLEESIYGWAVCMIVRDVVWIMKGTALPFQRTARIINSVILIAITIALQVFLLMAISKLLCAPAVYHIRDVYGKYQDLMYAGHTTLTVNGFPRGVPGFLVEENFKKLSEGEAKNVCDVPLSHPFYLCSILFIWTLTCQVELRIIAETAVQLFWRTPTVQTSAEVLEDGSEEHVVLVKGLTRVMKIVLSVFVFLPRFLSVACLLYLGCRWLTATLGLGDVLLNGLALEFMVLLKELLYKVCVSQHNRVSTQRLLIRPLNDEHHAHCCTFFSAQVWGLVSRMWALYYVFRFQMVLPDYRWDVGYLCEKFVKSGPMV